MNKRWSISIVLAILVVFLTVGGVWFYNIRKETAVMLVEGTASQSFAANVSQTTSTIASSSKTIPALLARPIPLTSTAVTKPSEQALSPDIYVIHDDGTLIGGNNVVNLRAVERKFYALNPDKTNYDFLSIFTTFRDASVTEFHDMVNNGVSGIGNAPQVAGIADIPRLKGINFANYTYSPANISQETDIKNNLWMLDHETGHQWLMYVGIADGVSGGVHYTKWADTGFIKDGAQWSDAMGGWPWKEN